MLLSGCSEFKQTIGLEKTAPDEFNVDPHQCALEIPPEFDVLPAPNLALAKTELLKKEKDVPSAAEKKLSQTFEKK